MIDYNMDKGVDENEKFTLVLCAFSMLAVSSVSYNIIKKVHFNL